MVKTYCDVCKAEMTTNYNQVTPIKFHLYDKDSQINLDAEASVLIRMDSKAHLCVTCAQRVIKEGMSRALS